MGISAAIRAAGTTIGDIRVDIAVKCPTRRATRCTTRVRAINEEQAERLRLLPLASSAIGVAAVVGVGVFFVFFMALLSGRRAARAV